MILLFSGGLGFISEMKPVFYSWDPLLGDLSWVILASMLYFYLHKIFEGKLEWMVPSLLLLVAGIAASSTSSWMVKHIGYSGWLVWSLLIILLIKVDHPPVAYMEPLTPKRRILAFVGLLIFALCFSIKPLYIG
jgi:hypothetical protein